MSDFSPDPSSAAVPAPRTKRGVPVTGVAVLVLAFAIFAASGCANFKTLGKDLKFTKESELVGVDLKNGADFEGKVYGIVMDTNPKTGAVVSADVAEPHKFGNFGFYVDKGNRHYLAAYADMNGNSRYEPGEPAWYHANEKGQAIPIEVPAAEGKGKAVGVLSNEVIVPEALLQAAREFRGDRALEEVIDGNALKITLGEVADLSDDKFSSVRGEEGLWEPASFPMKSGIGIYFLEEYDPKKIPVLFVYGMSGSPQDWQPFFKGLDRSKYQPWFYYYPTGRRLDEMGEALNRGIQKLQDYYQFDRMHVVAHSMGGLVSRSFITKNVLRDGNSYVVQFVSISTPWGGHGAAAMGVKHAPQVVPSWNDMQKGSKFQTALFSQSLKGTVNHYLLYGYKAKKSPILPDENDGTVSVASQLQPKIRADVVYENGFDSDHVGILSNPEVIQLVSATLDAGDGAAQEDEPQSVIGRIFGMIPSQ